MSFFEPTKHLLKSEYLCPRIRIHQRLNETLQVSGINNKTKLKMTDNIRIEDILKKPMIYITGEDLSLLIEKKLEAVVEQIPKQTDKVSEERESPTHREAQGRYCQSP